MISMERRPGRAVATDIRGEVTNMAMNVGVQGVGAAVVLAALGFQVRVIDSDDNCVTDRDPLKGKTK